MKQLNTIGLLLLSEWTHAITSQYKSPQSNKDPIPTNAKNHSTKSRGERNLQITGTCTSSTLTPGALLSTGSYLCHPSDSDSPTYQFGIDSDGNLAYYAYDTLIWKAVPNTSESTACAVFGNCDAPMAFLRLQNGGSLAGYDADRNKIWDSHENIDGNGEYVDDGAFGGDGETDATGDKVSGSTLVVNEDGVFIESSGGEVTWRILAPDWEAPSVSPVRAPSASPVEETREPTGRPSPSPTAAAADGFLGISGRVFEDQSDSSSIVGDIVVDLYGCDDSEDPTWIVMTRTNSTGHYILEDDDGETDLSAVLAGMSIATFRAVFSGLAEGYAFSPTVSGSDVDSEGQTACWDVGTNGLGSIVWNAGVMAADDTTDDAADTASEGTDSPTGKPTTNAPTSKPSSSRVTTEEPTSSIGLIGGYAFLDADDNGVRNPDTTTEPPFSNINVELFSCGNSASYLGDDEKLAVDRTNSQGMYTFRNLTNGFYRINVEAPDGFSFSSVWSGNIGSDGEYTDPDADSAVNPDTGSTPCFRVEKGNTDLSWGFGLRNETAASSDEAPAPSPESSDAPTISPGEKNESSNATVVISGFVFYDKDEDGNFAEGDEEAISNVDVALFDCNGTIIFVGSTDENGMYGFNGVKQASYSVKFSPPTGYEFSTVWSGARNEDGELISEDADSDVDPETGLVPCRSFSESTYSLHAGMVLSSGDGSSSESTPSSKPTNDPRGDGTTCSGGKCPEEGHCRNVAGICGSGLSFCNFESVWTPDCVEEGSTSPTETPVTVMPTISIQPTLSRAPSQKPSVYTVSVCNKDGTYGATTLNTQKTGQEVKEHQVTFTYSLLNESGESFEDAAAQFEEELSLRLACQYFAEDPCLKCERRLRRSRRTAVEGNSVVGISSKPTDEQNLAEACAFPNYNCRVMSGVMTSYFPVDTPVAQVLGDTNEMLTIISDEMAKQDWNGVTVSYANEPIQTESAEREQENEAGDDGGFPVGAIVGIAIAALVALGAVVFLMIFLIRDRREKEQQRMAPRIIPYGEDGGSDFDKHDSDSDSSSSEDDMSGMLSAPSATSGVDSYPTTMTTMAHAKPQDIEDDSSSSSGSSTGSDDDDESADYESGEGESNLDSLKTSAGSDDAPPVYEQDDGDYAGGDRYPSRYSESSEEMGDGPNYYDEQQQYMPSDQIQYDDQMQYSNQMRSGDDGSGGSAGSLNSADPPGRSFRDLHKGDEWDHNMLPLTQPMMSPNPNIIDDGFYLEDEPKVYENDDTSNPGSYRSGRSNRSNRSSRSKSRDKNQAKYQHNSFSDNWNVDDEEYIGDVRQAATENELNESMGSKEFRRSVSSQSHSSRGSTGSRGSRGRYSDHEYMDYEQQTEGSRNYQQIENDNSYSSFDQGYNQGYDQNYDDQRYGQAYDQNYADQQQYNSTTPPNEEDQDSYYDESMSRQSHAYHQDGGAGYADDTTTYSDSTRQTSNIHQSPPRKMEQLSETTQYAPNYDEEEESISNIFKSLSEIQTKLAKKGKSSSSRGSNRSAGSSGNRSTGSGSAPQQQGGVWREGVVEDVSVDGSQMSSFEARAAKNQRPKHGTWMEPVEEYEP